MAQVVVVGGMLPMIHYPFRMQCPHCRAQINTAIRKEIGCGTHIWAGGLCLIGCWPCFWIPYICDCSKDTIHMCPNCGAVLGVVRHC